MQYITKVDEYHVIEVNGVNIQVRDDGSSLYYKDGVGRIELTKCNLRMQTLSGNHSLAAFVLLAELYKLIQEQSDV